MDDSAEWWEQRLGIIAVVTDAGTPPSFKNRAAPERGPFEREKKVLKIDSAIFLA